jgi:hypothetical protein
MQCTEASSSRARAVPSRMSRSYAAAACALVLGTAFVACSGESPTAATPMPTPSALRAAVTGAAADAIGPNDQIQLARHDGAEHEITAAQAVSLASAWARDYAPITRDWLERTHGAAINFKALKGCGRPLYARSALSAPPETVPGPYRRVHGPWWLVTFCDEAGSSSVSIAVSAWANELTIQEGKLRFPSISGTEFVAIGVPAGHVGEYPMAPEIAIVMAAEQAGKRIAKVPELITPLPSDGPPQLARWRLTLEAPTTARTESGQHTMNEIFVGPTSVGGRDVATSFAAPGQPVTIKLGWMPVPRVGEHHAAYAARAVSQTTELVRGGDTPVRVERISGWGN